MEAARLEALIKPYNPWWETEKPWAAALPDYERPVVSEILRDLQELKQVVSITGPRRVGKTTAVRQVIRHLLQRGLHPDKILYFSFDDPEVFASEEMQREIFDALVERNKKDKAPRYYFFDEIQRLPRWELFVKKYYDLGVPIRFVITGSASSPIFRSSQESLLGRIKDKHLLPFSFREYSQFRMFQEKGYSQALDQHRTLRQALLDGDGQGAQGCVEKLHEALRPYHAKVNQIVLDYCREGGFPEVWELPDAVRKIEYLMEQQIRKVLYEDLMMLTQYRKPENVLRFFVYLLAHPGVEINTTNIAKEAGVERRVVEENLPRLEMTDLILRIQKFSNQPLRVRQGNIKCYPVDMALRNAVLKAWDPPDDTAMGYFAENMVLRELVTWPEKIEVSYYREKDKEVDFVLTHGGNRHLPLEVKHRRQEVSMASLRSFMNRHKLKFGVEVTRDQTAQMDEVLKLPLRYFLLAT